MGAVALIIWVGSALLPRLSRLRLLGPERRLQAMAGLSLLCLALLRLIGADLNTAILASESPAFHIHVAAVVGALAAALAMGLAWSPVLEDARPGWPRWGLIISFLVPLVVTLAGVRWMPLFVLPVAVRTGWARQVAEGRRPLATIVSILGVAAVLLWPSIHSSPGGFWSSGAAAGTALFMFARVYLVAQLGMLALRFFLGLIFGPRRIGRRLLVSHMLAGLVPVALTALFAALVALLALAHIRATVASHLLHMQHRLSEQALSHTVDWALRDARPRTEEQLGELAQAVREVWPQGASWHPAGEKPATIVAHLRTPSGTLSAESRSSEDLAPLPPPGAWEARPRDTVGSGIVRYRDASFHVSEYRTPVGTSNDSTLRITVVEHLPHGQVHALEDRLGSGARIEESFSFTGSLEFVRAETGLTSDADTPSSLRSSLVLTPAQALSLDEEGRARWDRNQIPVLGMAKLSDLVPPYPSSRNPLGMIPWIIFATTALVFVGVETFAFLSALRMGRAIAMSVGTLRDGTERIRRGDFSHRIELAGRDELTSLGEAFNEMAVGLAEAAATLREKERLEAELDLARRIQQRLLPANPPSMPGLQLAGLSVPARQVGGDYYDFLPIDDHRMLVVMADVSGKGAPAALLMSSLRASIHSMHEGCESLTTLARRLNQFVHESTSLSEFVTIFLGLVDTETGELCYVNAGHEFPYLVRKDQSIERLCEGGLMMGAFPNSPYSEEKVQLHPGDLLFMFTDGLTEAHDPDEHMFGEDRCTACLRAAIGERPEAVLEKALHEVEGFVRGAEPTDDITLMAMRRE